jgi:hypothetical protein
MCVLNHAIKAVPVALIRLLAFPGKPGGEAEVGDDVLVLSFTSSGGGQGITGGRTGIDLDRKEYRRCGHGNGSGTYTAVVLHVYNALRLSRRDRPGELASIATNT